VVREDVEVFVKDEVGPENQTPYSQTVWRYMKNKAGHSNQNNDLIMLFKISLK
jgi:hypothetical protein